MNEDLGLVSTEDLKAELERRYDTGVILLNRSRSASSAEIDFRWWGSIFESVGLARAAQVRMERDAADLFSDDDEG